MATVGDKLTIPFVVGAGAIVGQGPYPELVALYSTDDATDTDPLWQDATAAVRSFGTARGRETELADVDAGTATVTLSNADRTFDSTLHPEIRPMNRWKLLEQFSGETQSIFVGYAEGYDQTWPGYGKDAVCVVSLADEYKVLALAKLPTTDPPRDSYADVVMFDEPTGYWRMDDLEDAKQATAVIGPTLTLLNGTAHSDPSLIVGDPGGALTLDSTVPEYRSPTLSQGDAGDPSGLSEFSFELWLSRETITVVGTATLAIGPLSGAASMWRLLLNTAGTVAIEARNSSGTLHTATSGTLASATTYHVVGAISGGNLRLYINGAEVAATAWTGAFGTLDADQTFHLGKETLGAVETTFDEVAFYRYGLAADRVAAHYTAGASRGFPSQLPGARLGAVLDAVSSQAPRRIQDGTRTMIPAYMHGQDPLGELRKAETAEAVDALLYISRSGEVVFLADGHRTVAPHDTVQATFGDAGGAELPYRDPSLGYADSFIANEWHVTRTRGLTQSATDAASQGEFGERPQSLTDLPITLDADAQDIADAMLAKYAQPFQRGRTLNLKTNNPALAEAVFRLDIGDRIRLLLAPPGGGARIDQTLFVQHIAVDMDAHVPIWDVKLGVSPL